MSFILTPTTTTGKTVISTATTFFIDAVNGVDGSNDGLTTGTAFQSLFYCLVLIRDNYIIDAPVTIKLLSDITITDEATLRGFEIGKNTTVALIIITGEVDINNLAVNYTITVDGSFSLYSASQDISFVFEYVNFSAATDFTPAYFLKCSNISFQQCRITNIDFVFDTCSDVSLSGNTGTRYCRLTNASVEFLACNSPDFSGIELENDSFIKFKDSRGVLAKNSKLLTIRGVKTNNTPYLTYENCTTFAFTNGIAIDTATIAAPLLKIQNCYNIEGTFSLNNSIGGAVTYAPVGTLTPSTGSLYQVYRSDNILLTGGNNTKFINAGANGAIFIDETSEVRSTSDTAASRITNLPITGTINNLITSDAFYNGSNYRTTTALTATVQSNAIDEVALRWATQLQSVAGVGITMLNTSPGIQLLTNTLATVSTITLPTTPALNKFLMFKSNSASVGNFQVTVGSNRVIPPGQTLMIIWDGTSWNIL
jgi:hypothetical protein